MCGDRVAGHFKDRDSVVREAGVPSPSGRESRVSLSSSRNPRTNAIFCGDPDPKMTPESIDFGG